MLYFKWLFNTSVWVFVLWLLMCAFASFITWDNYFSKSLSELDTEFRAILTLGSLALIITCRPSRADRLISQLKSDKVRLTPEGE